MSLILRSSFSGMISALQKITNQGEQNGVTENDFEPVHAFTSLTYVKENF